MIPLLLIFASFLRPGSAADPLACSPRTCGNLNIAYPFWLQEDGQPPCGSPTFQLNCSDDQALLTRSWYGRYYQVLRIFAENSSFVAVGHDLPLATGCPAPRYNVTFVTGMGPFVLSKNKELLVLYNCTKEQATTPRGFLRTPCGDKSFFNLGGDYGGGQLPPSCHLTVPAQVLDFANGSDYIGSMRRGFLLEWTVTSGDCPGCVASGGQCRYGNDGTEFYCSCNGTVCCP